MIDALTNGLARVSSPAFMITLVENKRDITHNISPRLIALKVTDKRGFEADELSLTLDDSDGQIELPARQTRISVAIGRKGLPLTEMGIFTVDQVTHNGTPDQVIIQGRSVDFLAGINNTQEKSWHDTTLGAIADEIARRNNLTASVAPELAAIKIAHIDQTKESDSAFLTRLATLNGAQVAIKSGKLIFLVPGKGERGGEAVSLVTIRRSDGDAHSFMLADRKAYGSVIANWQDTKTPQQQKKQLILTRIDTENQAGADYIAGSTDNAFTLEKVFTSREEALRAAEAYWKDAQRSAASFTIALAHGRTDIAPETPVVVSGFKDVIDKTPWLIKDVTHVIDGKGFITSLALERRITDLKYKVEE